MSEIQMYLQNCMHCIKAESAFCYSPLDWFFWLLTNIFFTVFTIYSRFEVEGLPDRGLSLTLAMVFFYCFSTHGCVSTIFSPPPSLILYNRLPNFVPWDLFLSSTLNTPVIITSKPRLFIFTKNGNKQSSISWHKITNRECQRSQTFKNGDGFFRHPVY